MQPRERPRRNRIKWNRLLPLAVGIAALILYAATAAPSIVELYDDSLEFQLVAPTFAIAHPTGYPLYTNAGGIWSRVLFPFGNWAWRMNLFSAGAGAAAVAFVFLLARRLARGSNWAGITAAVIFALNPVWWRQTTVAEVYALHNLFVATILYTAVCLGDGQRAASGGALWARQAAGRDLPWTRRAVRGLLLLFVLIGFSLTHHRTTLLLLPGLGLYLLWRLPGIWRPRRAWLLWAAALLAPLLIYLYLPLRAAAGVTDLQGDYVHSWMGFWDHVLARGYTGFFADNPLAQERTVLDWIALLRTQTGWPALLLAGVGLAAGLLDRHRRPEWTLVTLALLANLLFALTYRVADVEVFLLPVTLSLALAAGRGVEVGPALGVRQVAGGRQQAGRSSEPGKEQTDLPLPSTAYSTLRIVPAVLVLLLVLVPLGRGPAVNRAGDWAAHDYAVAMATVDFPAQSQVVGLRGQTTALAYMQQAEGLGREAVPVAIDDPERRRRFVEEAVDAGMPVYLTQEVDGIQERFSFGGYGPLVRVWPCGQADAGTPTRAADVTLADGALRLTGYDVLILQQAGAPDVGVAFYWLPTRPLTRILKLSLRLQTETGEPILDAAGTPVVADRFPLRQVAHTPAWPIGEVVRDAHVLALPEPMPADARLLVIVYDAVTVEEVGRFAVDLPPLRT